MMNNNATPAIRFKGFTEAWEQRKLGDIGRCQSGIGFPDVEQGGKNGIPFFKVSDMNTPGNETEMLVSNNYVSDEQIKRKKWKPIYDTPAMFFAKVGAAVMLNRKRLVTTPFLLDNNTMAYIFGPEWDEKFGKAIFETIYLPSLTQIGALPSYNASDVEEVLVYMPSTRDEQIQIGCFFEQLEKAITLHQRKYDKLVKVKKSCLEKMFPKNGSNVPEIRFAGFTDAWEQRKLEDICSNLSAGGDIDKSQLLESGKYPVIANALTNDGIVGYYNESYRIKAPAVTVTGRGDVGHAKARKINFTPVVRLLTLETEHDVDFIENAINRIDIVTESTGVPQLTVPQLSKYIISIPPTIDEEKRIGDCFVKLDNLITLHQRKLEKLRDIKKSCLEKMFVN